MSRYFVKFVPYNEQTIAHLVNKTVKFSTVFEFNDFNEYRYFSTPYREEQCDQNRPTKELMIGIKKKAYAPYFNQNMLQLAMETRTLGYKNIIEDFLN